MLNRISRALGDGGAGGAGPSRPRIGGGPFRSSNFTGMRPQRFNPRPQRDTANVHEEVLKAEGEEEESNLCIDLESDICVESLYVVECTAVCEECSDDECSRHIHTHPRQIHALAKKLSN